MARTIKFYDIYQLNNAWEQYQVEHPDESWTALTYTDEDENVVTVIDGDLFWDYMITHFASFYYPDPVAFGAARGYTVYHPETSALRNFRLTWDDFLTEHPEFARLAQMMDRTDYDPLENYDRHEDGGWKDTTDDNATHNMKYDEVKTTTKNDPRVKTKTTGNVFPDDSATAVPDTESITEPVRVNNTDVDTIETSTPMHTDQSFVVGDVDVTRTFQNYRVHGNVGVTTAAQMIAGEMETREKYNLVVRVLEAFAKDTLTLQKEVLVYDD